MEVSIENVRRNKNSQSRKKYGLNQQITAIVLNPSKRKLQPEKIVLEKKARFGDSLNKMTNSLAALEENLKSLDDGFIESPHYIENGKMLGYQIAGLNWLIALYKSGLSGILADETGLGKTIQSISLIGYLQRVLKVNGQFLVVVPLSTLTVWENEFRRWCPSLNVISLYGHASVRQQTIKYLLNEKPYTWDVCLTTYETCKLQYSRTFLNLVHWHYVILDEGTRMKHESSLIAHCVQRLKSAHRLILTGTALNNMSLHELWRFISFLLPKEFESSIDVAIRFDDKGSLQNEPEVVHNLQALLEPLLLRRLKSEVEDIIPYKEIKLYVDLTHCQREWYRKILMENVEIVTGNGKAKIKKLHTMYMQLRKCTNHPYQIHGAEAGPPYSNGKHLVLNSGKMIVLDRLLAKLNKRKSRVLIFSQFKEMLDILEDYLTLRPQYDYCRIDSRVKIANHNKSIDEFQDPQSKKFIFLLTRSSSSMGINLTAADSVIFYDSDWNPQMNLQAISRAHRIGQSKEVRVFHLIAKGTVDEMFAERAGAKLKLADIANNSQLFMLETDAILSNDFTYNYSEWDKLVLRDSNKLVDQLFESV
ncbi:Chromatin-remodeling complex ATPase chain Iswi [Pseudolycoriella hygida]|uniref:Chromatin-remodeling complex ATPase chain Iswi n=1 Tax=Pseudolycoriella hygida TaxID=35572 RepID=A0A9Q0S2K4_9DIPT|nr:Chromatin-remodeling complex ATPase chain Iswi [Pseudolycoriella hygida]